MPPSTQAFVEEATDAKELFIGALGERSVDVTMVTLTSAYSPSVFPFLSLSLECRNSLESVCLGRPILTDLTAAGQYCAYVEAGILPLIHL